MIALEELEAIPPKHFAANERQGLEEAFDHVLNRLAVRGADDYTAFLSRRLLAAIRHQAKVCASRAHRQDIRNEADRRVQDAERLARKAKREASREFEYKGDGTQEDVARANALPVSVEPEIMESKPGPKARRAQHQAVKKQVAAKRDTELDTLTKGIARNGRGRRAA